MTLVHVGNISKTAAEIGASRYIKDWRITERYSAFCKGVSAMIP